MPSTRNKLEIIIEASGRRAAKEIASFAKQATTRMKRMADQSEAAFKRVTSQVFSLKGALVGLAAGYGLQRLATSFVDTASGMDQMRISLDTITKGHGDEWFERLNAWALKMPINTEKAIQSFIMMRAMGLKPTTKDMTILVDATSALGGKADTLEGIARALGQMATKGKVSAEELMQLTDRGIPAMEILKEKLGLTGEQLGNIGAQGIDASRAIQALLEGMAERYGGQSARIQNTWVGLVESLKSYWKEFQRLVMRSGVMKALETGLSNIISKLDELKRTGKLDKWAQEVAIKTLGWFKAIVLGAGKTADTINDIWPSIKKEANALWDSYKSLPGWVRNIGIVGAIMMGKKGAVAGIGILHLIGVGKNMLEGVNEVLKGNIKWSEFATMNADELAKKLEEIKSKRDELGKPFVRMKIIDPKSFTAKAKAIADEIDKIINKAKLAPSTTPTGTTPTPETPPKPKTPTIDAGASKEYEALHAQVMERVKRATLSATDFKIWQLDRWYKHAVDVYRKAGKDTTELDLQYIREKLAIEDEAAQRRKEQAQKEVEEQKRFMADRLNAYREMHDTLREFGVDDYEFRKSLIEKQAEEYRQALRGQADAEALINEWRQAEMARLDEERFTKQHEVMDALRESWGLTWQEIRQGAVNVWQDIGEAMATVTHQIGSSFTAVVTGAKSAKDAAKELFKSMLRQAISTLVQIAAQKLIFAAIQKKVMAGITATTVASMTSIAAAAAPAAMLTSIATGGGSAEAGAAAFTAAMGTMSGVTAGVMAAMSSVATAAQGSVGAPFAAGGIETKPTYHLIAEEGPEAVVPLSPRRRREARAILGEIVPVVMPEATSRPVVPALGPLRSEPEIHVYVQMDFHGDVKLDADLDEIREGIGISVEDAVRGALS